MQAQRITAIVKGFEDRGPFACVIPFPEGVTPPDDLLLNPIFEASLRQSMNTDRRTATPPYCITNRENIEWPQDGSAAEDGN